MEQSAQLGMNKTGIQMSPMEVREMLEATEQTVPSSPGDETAIGALRGEYMAEAEPLGSVPVPGTFKGAVKTGMQVLTGNRPQVLVDKLGERLAFERSGTRLYEALLSKCRAGDGQTPGFISASVVSHFRDEEAKHFEIVAEAIESLGGDATAQTPSADLAGIEGMGLMQAVSDPRTTIADSLHAILVAELADGAGWETLIRLCEDMGQDELADRFRPALQEEGEHLRTIRAWYEQAVLEQAGVGKG